MYTEVLLYVFYWEVHLRGIVIFPAREANNVHGKPLHSRVASSNASRRGADTSVSGELDATVEADYILYGAARYRDWDV